MPWGYIVVRCVRALPKDGLTRIYLQAHIICVSLFAHTLCILNT